MRTPTPTMEVKGDTPEEAGLPASPKPCNDVIDGVSDDVIDDVSDDVSDDISDTKTIASKDGKADTSCDDKKRHKRPAETSPTASTKSTKTSKETDVSIRQMMRLQKLAHEHHIMEVVQSGDARELKRFLEQKEGKLNVNFFDKEGQTALHHSCTDGNFELVKLLLKFGADPRLANRDGWNPLHIATFSGHHDIMLFLLGCSAR